MMKLLRYLKIYYNLARYYGKYDKLVWRYFKLYHTQAKFNSGVYDLERRIDSYFNLEDGHTARFYYQVTESKLIYRSMVLESFDSELTTDLFVMASHFNNLLRFGKVIVDPEFFSVEFIYESELAMNILYPSLYSFHLETHYKLTCEIYSGFRKLVFEGEEPAIIIADILRSQDNTNSETK